MSNLTSLVPPPPPPPPPGLQVPQNANIKPPPNNFADSSYIPEEGIPEEDVPEEEVVTLKLRTRNQVRPGSSIPSYASKYDSNRSMSMRKSNSVGLSQYHQSKLDRMSRRIESTCNSIFSKKNSALLKTCLDKIFENYFHRNIKRYP